jgi:hypothetical protein
MSSCPVTITLAPAPVTRQALVIVGCILIAQRLLQLCCRDGHLIREGERLTQVLPGH